MKRVQNSESYKVQKKQNFYPPKAKDNIEKALREKFPVKPFDQINFLWAKIKMKRLVHSFN